MEKDLFLNYTHGTTLQAFCQDVLDDWNDDNRQYLQWIMQEKQRMRKKQPKLWAITASMQCYYNYLEKLEKILCSDEVQEELKVILEEVSRLTKKKIHALFLTQELACWPSLESVFDAAYSSEEYEVSLVYTPFFHNNYTEQTDYYKDYLEMGLPVQRHNEYDLVNSSPDIVFMIKPYASIPELYQTQEIEMVVPRIIYIPYGMEITVDLIKFGFQFYTHYRAWRHCAYGNVVKEYGTKYGYRNGENIAVWGHPKADHYLDLDAKRVDIPDAWKDRIKNRKVILWTPHHLIDLNDTTGTGTWLIWGETILKEAIAHPEICFILRPHPLMMGALVNSNAMTQNEADELRRKIDETENLIWDTNALYHAAFNAADAIITDGTTFSVEFLYTKKPILLTPRNMEKFYLYEDMLESYYIVKRKQDISDFMNMIRDGEDPLKEKRLNLYDRTFFIPDTGTVGEHIIKEIKKDLEKECRDIELNMILNEEVALRDNVSEMQEERVDKTRFPLFSILVLCYKNQNLLFGMLDSIFKQDYPRIQLVVSDDGSADFEVETVQRYIDSHKRSNIEQVVVRKNEKNMRTVPHINHAMSYVKGEYLVFTAADDRFNGTDDISTYVEQFLSNPTKEWLVAKCNMTTPDYKKILYITPTSKDEPVFLQDDARMLFSRWSRRGMAIPCCMAFKMTAFDLVGGFDLDYLFLEDWPLELKLLRKGNMPIFLDKITAIHSTGGISNSNDRYGKELRRLFYNDKYTLFRKEVTPYLSLLNPEDRKAHKQYMKEIMERHYFFYIDWPDTSLSQKIKLCMKKPIRFWWVFEQQFVKIKNKIPKKKLLLGSQILLVLSMLFLHNEIEQPIDYLFWVMGWIDIAVAVLMMLVGSITYPLTLYFAKKEKLRKELTN